MDVERRGARLPKRFPLFGRRVWFFGSGLLRALIVTVEHSRLTNVPVAHVNQRARVISFHRCFIPVGVPENWNIHIRRRKQTG